MRIAYILGCFPVMSETFIGNEIRGLEAAGHEVTIIALHRPEKPYQPRDEALAGRTHYIEYIDPDISKQLIQRNRWRLLRLLYFAWRQTTEPTYPFFVHAAYLAEYIRDRGCTHVHAHFGWGAATYAIAAAKVAKLPVSFTCHGSDVYARPLDLKLKCRSARMVFGVAPTITADLQKIAGRTPCHHVPCGVDQDYFRPAADSFKKHDRWLFASRLIDCKGIDDITAAWALLPADNRPKLDIIGDGPLKSALAERIADHKLSDSITLLGAKPASWLAEHGPYYRAFIAAFKQGSDGARDTAPMVLKEAMSMALPIVTTDFVDIPKLVGEECAILCPPASPEKLKEAVEKIQHMAPDQLNRMGANGRAKVIKQYSLNIQINNIAMLISQTG